MGPAQILDQAESELRAKVARVELLGEVEIQRQNADLLCRHLGRAGLEAANVRWPHCLAVGLVSVARFRYDGDAFWPHVGEAFELSSLDQARLGQWFEEYLRKHKLQTFAHLVTAENALRYLTPVLAHSLIPCTLVPGFMEKVVWPSIEDPWRYGANAEEIQQRIGRQAPVMARPLQRFILHGGRVARDIIDRALEVARDVEAGEVPGPLLPAWLQEEVVAWVEHRGGPKERRRGRRTERTWRPPVLRFDPGFCQVRVELPYSNDRDACWTVRLSGETVATVGYTDPWKQAGSAEVVPLERPFPILQVEYRAGNAPAIQRTLGELRDERPYLLFDARTGRALADQRYPTGSDWYVLLPMEAGLFENGKELQPVEDLGEPFGVWPGFTVRRYASDSAAPSLEMRLRKQCFRLERQQQASSARLAAPPTPAYLAPMTDGVLAFESHLPTIKLPPATGELGVDEYLSRWLVRARSEIDRAESRQRASELDPQPGDDGSYRLRLEPLIPGPDVGEWTLEVTGPLGRGLRERLVLLPDITFEGVESTVGVAGPDLPVGRVLARTRVGVEVLEEGDARDPAPEGWTLSDRNRNGRIPFKVVDTRTGREVRALLRLPVVEWRWSAEGVRDLAANAPLSIVVDEVGDGRARRLYAANPTEYGLALRLYDHRSQLIQERRGGARTHFDLAEFKTSLEAGIVTTGELWLELIDRSDRVLGKARVAPVRRHLEPARVEARDCDGTTIVSWSLRRPIENLFARIVSLARPWEDPAEVGVHVDGQGRCSAVVPRLPPGRYALQLLVDDRWTGRAPVGNPAPFEKGTLHELRNHIQALPPTVAGKLEDLLLEREDSNRPHRFGQLLSGAGPHQLHELLVLLFRACKAGQGDQLLSLPWSRAADPVARTRPEDVELLVAALRQAPSSEALKPTFVALGLDRAPALAAGDIEVDARLDLWSLWMPLGAFVDLRMGSSDPDAMARCADRLGYPSLAGDDAGPPGDPGITAEFDPGSAGSGLPEIGKLEGQLFRPNSETVEALRALLTPAPSRHFDRDGWVDAALKALEYLVAKAPSLERQRDEVIAEYRKLAGDVEVAVLKTLPGLKLADRQVDHRQYPWAYLCRVSLVVAAARRLLAHRLVELHREDIRSLDRCAEWLARHLAPVYERDLVLAEILCCSEYAWKRSPD